MVVHRKRGVSEQVFPIFAKGKEPPCYSAWGACMTRAGSRHGAWDQPLLFLATPATSFNHMFYSGTSPITCVFFSSSIGDFLTFFQDKEDSALLTLPLLRDHSSTLKAQQLTGCLVPSGWLAKNQKQKATKL